MNQRTVNALLSRGLASDLAEILSAKGFTLRKLQQTKAETLLGMGLSKNDISNIHAGDRPPIPEDTLFSVLSSNRRTCCVCWRQNKPIIVHHIKEWAVSRSHSKENLAVLCLDCHDLAHTKKQLSQNLTVGELKRHKAEWERIVGEEKSRTLLNLKQSGYSARWDWINCRRLFELVNRLGINIDMTNDVNHLKDKGFVDGRGFLTDDLQWELDKSRRDYFLDFGYGFSVANYLDGLLEAVIGELPVVDITPIRNKRREIKALVEMGSFISIQAPFNFTTITDGKPASKEVKTAYCQGYGLRVEFTFQPWYCTSCSAKHSGMAGRRVQTVFGFVRDITTTHDGELVISLSCLGAGTGFKRHEQRVISDFEGYY
ncbi:HNH endonuclease [Enterobacter cloacae]|uniref:HNH endonuclease signature motif containing protein n=1 Tax=Enterobacter cloacae complex TaxID=354276 RepID=UPI000267FB08|nr:MULTISPECIES: HNH endonuclease signature motif containing protein [Enterobacter cloacae complex]AFM59310.1 HNH endonuclease [Enterobacter cloacae subsp. dissolvens SDM]ELE9703064.1 HNH endonuclease [Enterobacter cloacae]MCK7174442.1 HNH endonuclease [Enterobacter cloacae]MDY3573318.1 HNH endonuclease signature motif containing protein [Enterobacter ludwigii]MRI50660.1 HNH endonuclease [Enterobacter ludwigii]